MWKGGGAERFDRLEEGLGEVVVARSRSDDAEASRTSLRETPHLAALERAGTHHVYGDTADTDELGKLVALEGGAIRREIDGNTANQPLVNKVVERYLDTGAPRAWARALESRQPGLSRAEQLPLLYAIVCGRVGHDMARTFGSGRAWEVSLQLHMALCDHPEAARRVGHWLRQAVPSAIVKVPFTPDAPHCFLVARDLERAGIPVNFTSTFSARQAVAAALLADVARTNIFMGRLNQGLSADLLGEHVDLEAQRALCRLRREDGVGTQLIVASMREWQAFVRVAGCDVFTAPCSVIRDFLEQDEVSPDAVGSRLEHSYEDELGVSEAVLGKLGRDGIARLYRVEPEFVEFLRELRRSEDWSTLDGEGLYKRFDQAGFGDFFHRPTAYEERELARGKLPDLDGLFVGRVALDTWYSLLANGDFARTQQEIDAAIAKRLEAGRE
jgi:transaldolase